MAPPDPQSVLNRIQHIVTLVEDEDSPSALSEIAGLVAELQAANPAGTSQEARPAPSRLIAAHLKAAEAQILATHLAPAQESLLKAIYVAVHGSSPVGEGSVELNV